MSHLKNINPNLLRVLSAGGGSLMEAPVFTLTAKGLHQALGQGQSWDGGTVAREIAAGASLLVSLRSFGWLGGQLYRVLGPLPGIRPLLVQGSQLTGILSSHHLSRALGIFDTGQPEPTWADHIATLVQFNMMGHFNRRLLGRSYHQMERHLDLNFEMGLRSLFPALTSPVLSTGPMMMVSRPVIWTPHTRGGLGHSVETRVESFPVGLEVKTESQQGKSLPGASKEALKKAVERLLTGKEDGNGVQLSGPIAEILRRKTTVRGFLQNPFPEGREYLSLQVDYDKAFLRSVVKFGSDGRPSELWWVHPRGSEGIGVDRTNTVFRLQFPESDSTLSRVNGTLYLVEGGKEKLIHGNSIGQANKISELPNGDRSMEFLSHGPFAFSLVVNRGPLSNLKVFYRGLYPLLKIEKFSKPAEKPMVNPPKAEPKPMTPPPKVKPAPSAPSPDTPTPQVRPRQNMPKPEEGGKAPSPKTTPPTPQEKAKAGKRVSVPISFSEQELSELLLDMDRAESVLGKAFQKATGEGRVNLAKALLPFLNSSEPVHRALAFDALKKIIPNLSF
ncbi:MAG: hypothetical protein R3257_07515, partial [bacterium]|nr:hypothetical protein [bacterium]